MCFCSAFKQTISIRMHIQTCGNHMMITETIKQPTTTKHTMIDGYGTKRKLGEKILAVDYINNSYLFELTRLHI